MITQIDYNWFSTSQGEEYESLIIGEHSVKSITPKETGNKFYYSVLFEDGSTLDIFNPNKVYSA